MVVPTPERIDYARNLKPQCRYCTCGEKPLSGKIAWLELDQRMQTYHDFGGVPRNKSQGWFPFGLTCAHKELAKAQERAREPKNFR